MSTTTSPPEVTAEQFSIEETPVFETGGKHVDMVDSPPLKEEPLLVPLPQETSPGRALRPKEPLSSALPLVLVRTAEHGKETVLPGYYACVGTMPCADTEYYLLVRWEHRGGGRQGERRVVLPEHIRVLDPEEMLLPPSLLVAVRPVPSSSEQAARQEDTVMPDTQSGIGPS